MQIKELGLYKKSGRKYYRIITVAEAGEMLNISRQAILKRIDNGELTAIRVHGKNFKKPFYFVKIRDVKTILRNK